MDLWKLVEWLDNHYSIVDVKDDSINGLQVEGREKVERVATLVDASIDAVKKAIREGADFIIVHHGLFWRGFSERVVRREKRIVKELLDNGVSLYAMHLPMDDHPETGNNITLAKKIGLKKTRFLREIGVGDIGVVGELPRAVTTRELENLVEKATGHPVIETIENRKKIEIVAVITGGASHYAGLMPPWIDTLVTGEFSHGGRILARESGITVIAGGHYATETMGPRAIAEKISSDLGLEAFFVDVPTGD